MKDLKRLIWALMLKAEGCKLASTNLADTPLKAPPCNMFNIQYEIFNVQYSNLGCYSSNSFNMYHVQYSIFNMKYSMFNIQILADTLLKAPPCKMFNIQNSIWSTKIFNIQILADTLLKASPSNMFNV